MQADHRAMVSAALGIGAVGAGVAVSDHLTGYPVLTAQAFRYGTAAVVLAVVARRTGRGPARLTGADRARLVALALTGMVIFNVAVVRALGSGEPAVVATIVGLAPVGLALVVPLLERRRPRLAIVSGACLAAAGAAVVEGFGRADLACLAWSAVALGGEVAFTALAAPLLRTLTPLALTVRACTLAAVLLGAGTVVVDGGAALPRPGVGVVLAVAYLAVASTALAFLLWYAAVARLGPERTGLFAGVMPLSAALVGAAVTPAGLRFGTLAGTVLVGTGLAVGLSARDRSAARPGQVDDGRSGVAGQAIEHRRPRRRAMAAAVPARHASPATAADGRATRRRDAHGR